MESKHKELLDKCYQNLLESITDADRVVEALFQTGTLCQSECYELGHDCSSNSEKVDLLLKMLMSKERDHFQDLCAALEKTHPHLNSTLLFNGDGPVDHSSGTTGQASSPPPAHLETRCGQVSEKMETVLFQLRQVTRERDELRKRLALSSPGTTFDDCRPNFKSGHDYERLKLQCLKAMGDLQSLQNQHSTSLKRCEEAVQKADFYHSLHSRVASEQAQLKEELEDNIQLIREHNHLKLSCEEMRRRHEEDQRELGDMRLLHQQVMRAGSSEILNKLYDTAMDKLEGAKRDYEVLKKRYNEKTAHHNADLSHLEQAEMENQRLQKQLDVLLKQRDAAMHYQQQYSTSMRRFDSTQAELSKVAVHNNELQREMERLQAENTRLKTQQLKAVKDCDKYKEERDSVFSEYRLIMSERDQVIKEVDKLQTGLELAEAKLKNTTSERRMTGEELEALRQIQDSATVDMERATKEIEVLRKQYEAMSLELKEAAQEAEVAKCRRDWAFQERDKIVAERESIRTLCDNLRRERDRAVSDLADVLRNLDDARKQKNDVSRELKELKEKLEDQLAKEARFQQLVAHNSHDSAIDTDSLEWETEVVELEKNREDMDLKALGFDVAKGLNDPYLPGDCGIFVSKVAKGSIAEGRLRVNDWLLKINNVDLANKDRKQVLKAVLSGEGVINVVVRRKKCLGGRLITPIQISLTGYKDSGIGLECGVFIAGVIPGSPSSREGSLTVGDRLIAINGIALDNKSLSECESLLCSCREVLSVSVIKFLPQSCSAQSLFENLGDASEKVSNCRSLHSGPEVHSRNCRNSRHHSSSTQTEMFCPDAGSSGAEGHGQNGGQRDSVEHDQNGDGSFCRRLSKPFSTRSLPQSPTRTTATRDRSYTGDSRDGDGDMNRGGCGEEHIPSPEGERLSGGTWPKITSFPEGAQLSIYKKPSQRKSIFDVDTFKRPETPTKLDYLSLSQLPKHSPQNSSEAGPVPGVGIGQIPPTPPQRSDSFRFRHRQQTSSASDSTITTGTGTPPATPGLDPGGLVPLGRKQEGSDPEGRERDRERDWEAEQEDRDLDSYYNIHILISSIVIAMNSLSPIPLSLVQITLDLQIKCLVKTDYYTVILHSNNPELTPPPPFCPFLSPHFLPPPPGSLSQSECSSLSHSTPPTSPVNPDTPTYTSSQSQSSISTSASQPRMSVSPAPTRDHRKDRPYLEEPRTVAVQKGTEPLGISIVNGESGGVFVSKVTAGSIAHQARLEYGDQLLEFNGINLRNANEQQARLVIGQQCDTITILAQYNPHMFQQGIHSRSSGQPAPQLSGATTPDRHFAVDTLSEQEEGTVTPPSNRTSVDSHHPPGVRLVQLKKTQVDLGLQICGGNLSGIYVESLENDSPANCPDGLLPGDQILEYNGVTMKDMTTEEAYLEMLKPSDTVAFKVQHCSDELMMVKNSPGDGFYIRCQTFFFFLAALYDRVAENELELSFKKDDILYVEDTLPNGTFGVWTAWQLDETARRLARGQIPSKYTMDQESCSRHSIPDGRDESGGKTLSAAARRSFFRRKQKHKRSGSKDGKDLATLDDIGTDSLTVTEDGLCLAYQRVQKVVCSRPRPVLILGPLVEANKDMLVKEAPGRFCRCPPEVMKASQQAIERGVKDCVFIDYKRRSGHFDVTTVAAIKEITEKDCHCLLDTAPHAIERLHSVHIYPIVIFIRYKNAKQIKEQKDHQYLRDKVSQKHSKEQFEMALKIEQEYSKFFTSVIQGGTLAYICTQVMNIVDQEQNKVLWIPEGAL
uniref:Discs, large homolog 5b (Drosophila), tandem duplicate 1 n=1 Tax=Esox lucius TaxID=8010 RepID=A0A6Q2X5Y0_ESOLU